jgi:hypothetical protein
MQNLFPIRSIDANVEVLARIAKATSKKFDCTMKIDFTNGKRDVEFIGDNRFKPVIAQEVMDIFNHKPIDDTLPAA